MALNTTDTDSVEEAIKRLAELSPLEYDQVRKTEAKRLGITRVTTLDAAVKAAQPNKGTVCYSVQQCGAFNPIYNQSANVHMNIRTVFLAIKGEKRVRKPSCNGVHATQEHVCGDAFFFERFVQVAVF